MNATPGPFERELSRRRVFSILGIGAAGVVGLSACAQGGDTPEEKKKSGPREKGEKGGGEESEVAVLNPDRVFHGAWPFELPPTGHFNFAPGVIGAIVMGGGAYHHLVLPPGGLWYWADQEWLYLIAESFEFTETTFVYNVNPNLTWSNGDPITADDVVTTFALRWLTNQPEWGSITGFEKTGDHQVTFELSDPSTVLERRLMKAPILPNSVYGQFGEPAKGFFDEGMTWEDKEPTEVRDKLNEWRPEDYETEVVVSGPFQYEFDTMTDSQITMVKNESGVLADKVEFEKLVLYNGETDDITPLVLDGTVDYATHGFPVGTQQQAEQNGYRILKPAVYSGPALTFSMGKKTEFADAKVRQALAHVMDKAEAAKISLDESAQVPTSMAGFSELQVPDWVDSETLGSLNPYDFDQDQSAALLEEAGWSLKGGKWQTPDGKAAKYKLLFPSDFADWPPTARYFAEVMGDFGIEIELDGIENPNMAERIDVGNFDIALQGWGAGEPHPQFAFTTDFVSHNYPITKPRSDGRGMDYDLVRKLDGEEVDIEKLITQAGESMDEELQKERISQLALIFNTELPKVPIWERYGNNPAQEGVRVLEWPADDDPIYQNSPYSDNHAIMLMYEGWLKPA